ncbi:MAG: hypothetical protein ACOYJX_00230 [Acutalibacteraceae bacterium]
MNNFVRKSYLINDKNSAVFSRVFHPFFCEKLRIFFCRKIEKKAKKNLKKNSGFVKKIKKKLTKDLLTIALSDDMMMLDYGTFSYSALVVPSGFSLLE